jgi:hypothetical protein
MLMHAPHFSRNAFSMSTCRLLLYEHEKISKVEEKPFTSSLNIYPEACYVERGKRGRSNAPLSLTPFFQAGSVDIFKDDVTVILILVVSLCLDLG